eukprot:TRINITY_DN618_c0_g1_i1.p1 TRINITY_DN618_c0_g1~~TRINITY_DN618_c0_g1_i1.p1  ORF type:complete len:300 (-),score=48.82 TRINITY_DN618_c0_g1_i1:404-1303(-)
MTTLAINRTHGVGIGYASPTIVGKRYKNPGCYNKTRSTKNHVFYRCRDIARASSRSTWGLTVHHSKAFFLAAVNRNDLTKSKTKRLHFYPIYVSSKSEAEEAKNDCTRSPNAFSYWLINLQNQSVFEWTKAVFQRPQLQLKLPEKDEVVKQIQEYQWQQHIANCWQSAPPWIRWPLLIWIPCCFAAMFQYGLRVSLELAPLWIFLTTFTAIAIRYYKPVSLMLRSMLFGSIQNLLWKWKMYWKEKLSQLQYFRDNWKEILGKKKDAAMEKIEDAIWEYLEKRIWKQYQRALRLVKSLLL